MGQRQKRRSEEGEEGTSELENNEYGSVESRERTGNGEKSKESHEETASKEEGAFLSTRSYSPLGRRKRKKSRRESGW